jgi:DNA-binding response OmpR family regulator
MPAPPVVLCLPLNYRVLTDLKVLYVEDEALLGRIVKESLESRGLKIDWFIDREAAQEALDNLDQYDIAVLDVQLPGDDGFAIGRYIRQRTQQLPILFLTARVAAKDALEGFAAGGNDYVRKPFSMEELLVRMQNLVEMNRSKSIEGRELTSGQTSRVITEDKSGETYRFASFLFDYRSLKLLRYAGEEIAEEFLLTHREAELLRFFLRARGQAVIERKRILLDLWQDDGFFNSRTLDVYVRKLRSMLMKDGGVKILTLRGVGYRFVVE